MKALHILCLLLLLSCGKKEVPGETDDNNPGTPDPRLSNSGSTQLSLPIPNFEWIGAHNNHIYGCDILTGTYLARFNTVDLKMDILKKYSSAETFQAIAHSVDIQGNIYYYAKAGGGNVGLMKIDANGHVQWKKKLKMTLSAYNDPGDMQPVAVKHINGYLWALSSLYLFKVNPENGEVLNTIGISSTGERWTPGQDIIKAGENIMVQMGGGQLHFHILRTSDLKPLKSVKTPFKMFPTSGFPTNTILDVAANRFFAVTHYREQSSLFPRGVIIEFDSDGKILNSAILKDGLDQFEVTRMHRDKDGNYAVAFNTTIELGSNLKTKDVLIFNKNLELIHKVSLPPNLKRSAISFNTSMVTLVNENNFKNTIIEWVDTKNPGCKSNNRLTDIKLESLAFNSPEVQTNVAAFTSFMSYAGSEDMAYTVEDVNFSQTVSACN